MKISALKILLVFAIAISGGCMPNRRPAAMGRRVVVATTAEALPLRLVVEDYTRFIEGGNPHTYRAYRNHLNVFCGWLCEKSGVRDDRLMFTDVTKSVLETFRDERLEIEASSTVEARLSAVLAMSGFASEKFQCWNAVAAVKLPKKRALEFRGLSREEMSRVLEHSQDLKPRDRFVIQLLYRTGLRNDESRNLLIGQINSDWSAIREIKGKGKTVRPAAISPDLRRELVRYMQWRSQYPNGPQYPLLVSNWYAKPSQPESWKVNTKTIWLTVNRALGECDVPSKLCHPHALRHTFAIRMLDELGKKFNPTVAFSMVQKLLGHTDINTTMIYLQREEEELLEAAQGVSI